MRRSTVLSLPLQLVFPAVLPEPSVTTPSFLVIAGSLLIYRERTPYTQHNDIQHSSTHHKGLICDTQHK